MDAAALGIVARAARIGVEIAGPAADDVDRRARFPVEAIDALRADGLLSVLAPRHLDGAQATMAEVAGATTALARHCASTAMVFAMHQIQVACLARHGASESLLKDIVADQLLVASATTEEGVGGDLRTSVSGLERDGTRFTLCKRAPVISYGAAAQVVLATTRAGSASQPGDQVLVVCRPPGLRLVQTGEWDTLGFRGTCSPPFVLHGEGDEEDILPDPFSDIAAQTMVPVAHVLWSAVWLGIAAAAAERAGRFVRARARKQVGVTSPEALRLAELVAVFQPMSDLVHSAAQRFDAAADDRDLLSGLGFTVAMNALKVSASTLVVDIVGRAMAICGIAGYREDSPYSMGRLLRDAHGAAVMVSNDRINASNAHMLLIHKHDAW